MIKLGLLVGLTSLTASPVATLSHQYSLNITVTPKDHINSDFAEFSLDYLKERDGDLEHSYIEYYLHIVHIMHTESGNPTVKALVQNRLETSYVVDPFYELRGQMVDKFIEFTDENPDYDTTQTDDATLSSLISSLANVSAMDEEINFTDTKNRIDSALHELYWWDVDPTLFGDIETEMQSSFPDFETQQQSNTSYFLSLEEYRTFMSDWLISPLNVQRDIERTIIDYFDNIITTREDELVELGFNVANNIAALQERSDRIRSEQLLPVIDGFVNNGDDIYTLAAGLKTVLLTSIDLFRQEVIDDMVISLNTLNPVASISASAVGEPVISLDEIVVADEANQFLIDHFGIRWEAVTSAVSSTEADAVLEILDVGGNVLATRTLRIGIVSDVTKVAELIENISFNPPFDFNSLDLEDFDDPISNQNIDTLFPGYIRTIYDPFTTSNPAIDITAAMTYSEATQQVTIVFTITEGAVSEEVIRVETLDKYVDDMDAAIEYIRNEFAHEDNHFFEYDIVYHGGSVPSVYFTFEELASKFNMTLDFDQFQYIDFERFSFLYVPTENTNKITISVDLIDSKTGARTTEVFSNVNYKTMMAEALELVQSSNVNNEALFKGVLGNWMDRDIVDRPDLKYYLFSDLFSIADLRYQTILQTFSNAYVSDFNYSPEGEGIQFADFRIEFSDPFKNSGIAGSLLGVTTLEIHWPIDLLYEALYFDTPLRDTNDMEGDFHAAFNDPQNPQHDEVDKLKENWLSYITVAGSAPLDDLKVQVVYPEGIVGVDILPFAPSMKVQLLDPFSENDVNPAKYDYTFTVVFNSDFLPPDEIDKITGDLEKTYDNLVYVINKFEKPKIASEQLAESTLTQIQTAYDAYKAVINAGVDEDDLADIMGVTMLSLMNSYNAFILNEDGHVTKILNELDEKYNHQLPVAIEENRSLQLIIIQYAMFSIDDTGTGVSGIPSDLLHPDAYIVYVENLDIWMFEDVFDKLDTATKVAIASAGVLLAVTGLLSLIPTINTMRVNRKIKTSADPLIKLQSPRKLSLIALGGTLMSFGASVGLLIFVFVTQGGI